MIEVEENIYHRLNLNKYEEFCPKWGSKPPILVGQLISALLKYRSGPKAMEALGRSSQTFNRGIKKLFPNISLNGGGQSWIQWLLLQSDYKYCGICETYKLKSCFGLDKQYPDGLDNKCKLCKQEVNAKWYSNNKTYHNKYFIEHRSDYVARNAKRRALLIERTVAWTDDIAIAKFYADCPKGYHVDHYYPLQGENVCGLHVLDNLQYLTALENMRKGNKMPE